MPEEQTDHEYIFGASVSTYIAKYITSIGIDSKVFRTL